MEAQKNSQENGVVKKRGRGPGKLKLAPEKLVTQMAMSGLNNTEIAEAIGVTDETLKKHFRQNLTKGRRKLKIKLRRKQIEIALQGNVAMLIWLGKQYLDQKDRSDEEQLVHLTIAKEILGREQSAAETQLPS